MLTLSRESFFKDGIPFYINRIAESFELQQHKHDFIEINYVSEGKGFHYINNEIVPSLKGDVFFLPIGVSHVFRPSTPDSKHRFIVYNCLLTPESIMQIGSVVPLPSRVLGGQTWYRTTDSDGSFNRLFTGLHYEFVSRKVAFETRMYAHIIELIGRLEAAIAYESLTAPKMSSDEELFEQGVRYLHDNLSRSRLSASDVAESLGIDRSQIFRLFKKYTGCTFVEFLQKERIDRSCELLRSSTWSVPYIAELCGYADVKYFHKVFSRLTGNTPHHYRLQHQMKEGLSRL